MSKIKDSPLQVGQSIYIIYIVHYIRILNNPFLHIMFWFIRYIYDQHQQQPRCILDELIISVRIVKTWDKSSPFPVLFRHLHQSWSPLYRILLKLYTEHSNKFWSLLLSPTTMSPLSFQPAAPVLGIANHQVSKISHYFLPTLSRQAEQCRVTVRKRKEREDTGQERTGEIIWG